MRFITRLIIEIIGNAAALWVATRLIPGFSVTPTVEGFFVTALLLALVNLILRPLLKFVLTPLIILTLGLLTIILNAGLLLLVDKFSGDLTIDGLVPLFLATILMSIVNGVFHGLASPFKS